MGRPENTMSENDSICTPEVIWKPIVETLGEIQFDPASNPASMVPAATRIWLPKFCMDPEPPPPGEYRTADGFDYTYGDGLKFDWGGVGLTFLNGPYSQLPDQKRRASWWGKFLTEVDEGIHFFPVRTACDWWQAYVPQLTTLTFLSKRVVHDNNYATKPTKRYKIGDLITDAAAFSQALGYVGPRPGVWLPTARKLGWTLELHGNPRFGGVR